jgi:hypothetical protein
MRVEGLEQVRGLAHGEKVVSRLLERDGLTAVVCFIAAHLDLLRELLLIICVHLSETKRFN